MIPNLFEQWSTYICLTDVDWETLFGHNDVDTIVDIITNTILNIADNTIPNRFITVHKDSRPHSYQIIAFVPGYTILFPMVYRICMFCFFMDSIFPTYEFLDTCITTRVILTRIDNNLQMWTGRLCLDITT
jgi:hypothetical protein